MLVQAEGLAGPASPPRRGGLLSPGARYVLLRLCLDPHRRARGRDALVLLRQPDTRATRSGLSSAAWPPAPRSAPPSGNSGLNQGLWTRYLHYMNGLLHGSLGSSYYGGQPVAQAIEQRFVSSAELIIPAFLLAYLIGVTLGGIGAYYQRSALRPGRRPGRWRFAQAIPDYVIGLLGLFLLFYVLARAARADRPAEPHHNPGTERHRRVR